MSRMPTGGPAPRRPTDRVALPLALATAAVVLAFAPGVRAALSASIADLSLPAVTTSHAEQMTSGTMMLTVTQSTVSLGWSVTIQAGPFTYAGPYGGSDIPAAHFAITAAAAPTRVSGQAIDPVGGPKVPASGATGTLDAARKTIQALTAFGTGTYRQELAVGLRVPANSRAGTYTAQLTVTTSTSP